MVTYSFHCPGGNPIPPPAVAVVNAQANEAEVIVAAIGIGLVGDAVVADEAAGGVIIQHELEHAAAAAPGAPGIVDEHV